MLCGDNLSYEINDVMVIDDLSLVAAPGAALRVEGDNGAGKTTLLRLLCGLARPDRGAVRWNNEDIARNALAYHRNLTYIGHASALRPELGALENLQFLASLSGLAAVPDYPAALAWAGLRGLERRPVGRLSYGQRRRVVMARLLVESSLVWILDEPLAGLDQAMAEALKTLFLKHLARGGLLVVSSHQPLDLGRAQSRRLRLGAPA